MSIDNLVPLPEAVEALRRETEQDIRQYAAMLRQQLPERIANLESTRLAAQLLEGLADLEGYGRLSRLTVQLGYFPNSKRGNARLARRVRQFRIALGCRLEVEDKNLASDEGKGRRIAFRLKPVDFPSVRLRFTRPFKADGKCRIVKTRYTTKSLVCDLVNPAGSNQPR